MFIFSQRYQNAQERGYRGQSHLKQKFRLRYMENSSFGQVGLGQVGFCSHSAKISNSIWLLSEEVGYLASIAEFHVKLQNIILIWLITFIFAISIMAFFKGNWLLIINCEISCKRPKSIIEIWVFTCNFAFFLRVRLPVFLSLYIF